MNDFAKKFPGIIFAIKCAFTVGFIMFIFMAIGEIFVDSKMFGGFLKKPQSWLFVFFESAIWLLPFMLIMLPILRVLRKTTPQKSTIILTVGWAFIGLIAVIGYKLTYFPTNWSFEGLVKPEIVFGWVLPCLTILLVLVYFSQDYVRYVRLKF